MRLWWLVALGGAIGAVLRFAVAAALSSRSATFPTGTLAINLVGCLLIGLCAGYAGGKLVTDDAARALLVSGFLGGFTTFSAFGLETQKLLAGGQSVTAVGYVLLSNVGGIALVWIGALLGRKVP